MAWAGGTVKVVELNRAAGLPRREFGAGRREVTVRSRPNRTVSARVEGIYLAPLRREVLAGNSPVSAPEIAGRLTTPTSARAVSRALAELPAQEPAEPRGRGREGVRFRTRAGRVRRPARTRMGSLAEPCEGSTMSVALGSRSLT